MLINPKILVPLLALSLFTRGIGQDPSASATTSPQPDRTEVTMKLKRGDFMVYRYHPGQHEFSTHPRALVIFGSGDGGFANWEDRVCKGMQADGYEMVGFDCARYSQTDYNQPMLQADLATIAQTILSEYGDFPPPLIYGGWSMGAVQAVAAGAQSAYRPKRLVGLLLISAAQRGRYGLRTADRWEVPPTGPGTFAVADFEHQLDPLRIVQWTGDLDPLDSTKWLNAVTAIHKVYSFPYGLHDFNGASDSFLKQLSESINWIIDPPSWQREMD